MTSTYARAYTEIIEILKYLPANEYNQIPSEELEFYEEHKDHNYIYNYDPRKTLKEQNISREANAILVTIFRDFFATDIQKEKLSKILNANERKYQEELRIKYNPDNIFKNRDKINIDETNSGVNVDIIKYKKSFFTKIIRKIKSIFSRN